KCPHFDRCFLFQARRRAAEADIVVVNHHLLASDLAVRMASDNWQEAAVLPPYRRLVLDEAHHLEDVAAMHLGSQVSMLGVQRLLWRLEKNGRGLLPTLRAVLANRDDLLSAASRDLVQQSLLDAVGAARRAADELFARLTRRLEAEQGPTPVLRLTDEFARDDVWPQGLDVALDNLLLAFSRLRDGVETIADRLSLDDPSERRAQLVGELRGVVRRLDAVATGLTAALRPPAGGPAAVRWVERRGRKVANVSLAAVPLDLAPILKDNLFDRVATVVLPRATLAAGGEFGYLEERLGLDLPPSRACWWSWRTRRTAACSCCSRATAPCAAPPTRCATSWAAAGRCWFRATASATSCCGGSARRAPPSCSAPIRSGRASTCPAAPCGCCSSRSCRSRGRASRSARPAWSGSPLGVWTGSCT